MNLFNRKILNQRIANYSFPKGDEAEKIATVITNWQKALKDSDLSKTKEKSIQGKFLNVFFEQVLGYQDKTSGEEQWTLVAEPKTEVDAQTADGAIGFFTKEESKNTTVGVIELKDAKTSLDKKQKGRDKGYTPVEQAYLYATKFDRCKWIIVSNFREIRLYNKARSEQFYEKFDVLDLHKEDEFKRFYFLLSKENLIAESGESPIDDLAKKSNDKEEDISKKFYSDYKDVRELLFHHLAEHNKEIDKKVLFEKSQKILDRIVFILFCEDTANLLPKNILKETYELGKRSRQRSDEKIWLEMKNLFMDIDEGREDIDPKINGYNGGLFKFDEVLDTLTIKDDVWDKVIALCGYDFETDLNVNILGHIFEQSISDIENMKAEIKGEDQDKSKSKRKKDGIFYTPEYITKYIVENTVGKYLEENPDKLASIKILDPACGSGAFLNQAHSFLLNQYKVQFEQKMMEKQEKGEQQLALTDINLAEQNRSILLNNLFGVDLNDESVEITKLSLWLKTARKDEPLQNLDENIKVGNSLIDDPEVAGEKAFDWNKEYKSIMKDGGFDVIIGNPPYGVDFNDREKELLEDFDNIVPDYEIYIYFVSKALELLNEGGIVSYIFPNTFLTILYGKKYRKWILDKFEILSIVDLSDDKTFEDASVRTCIFTIRKNSKEPEKKLVELYKYTGLSKQLIEPSRKVSHKYLEENIDNWLTIAQNSEIDEKIIERLKAKDTVNAYFEVSQGYIPYRRSDLIKDYGNEKGNAIVDNREWHSEEEKKGFSKELKGRDINKFAINWSGTWVNYGKHVASYVDEKFFKSPRVLIREITGDKGLITTYSSEEFYNNPSIINVINSTDSEDYLLNLVCILNSKLIGWYHNKTSPKARKGLFPKILINDVRNLPFPNNLSDALVQYAKKIILKQSELDKLVNNAIELLKGEYKFKDKRNFNLEQIGWNELIEEFEKQKIKLSLNQKEELLKWFRKKQKELQDLQAEIDKLDRQIDQEVYKLYGLTKEEIDVIDGANI